MSVQKFIDAQARGQDIVNGATWEAAINELRGKGKKMLHYSWYIFPQLAGVTLRVTRTRPTAISRYYAISNLEQAVAYLRNGDLRNRLMIFATEIAHLCRRGARIGSILGIGDGAKFRSSMTLFLIAAIAALSTYSFLVASLLALMGAVDVSLTEVALGAGVTGVLLVGGISLMQRRSID